MFLRYCKVMVFCLTQSTPFFGPKFNYCNFHLVRNDSAAIHLTACPILVVQNSIGRQPGASIASQHVNSTVKIPLLIIRISSLEVYFFFLISLINK